MRITALCCLISLALLQAPDTHAQNFNLGGVTNVPGFPVTGSGALTDNQNLATELDQTGGVQIGNAGQTSSNIPSISNNPITTNGATPISGTGTTISTATPTTSNGVPFDTFTNNPPGTIAPATVTNTTLPVVTDTGSATGATVTGAAGQISTDSTAQAPTAGAGATAGGTAANTAIGGTAATTTGEQFSPISPAATPSGATTTGTGTAGAAAATLGTGAAGLTSTTSAECLAVQDCVDNGLPDQTQSCASQAPACASIQQESTAVSAGVLAQRSILQRGCNRTFTSQRACLRCYNRAARQLRFSQDQALLFGLFRNAAELVRLQAAQTCGTLP